MKVVIDTNVLISSIFWKGNEYRVIELGIEGKYRLVISTKIIDELIDTLRNKFEFPEDKLQDLIDLIFTFFEIIEPVSKFNIVRDKKDNMILESAYDSKADYIITGDKDLLVLKEHNGCKIINSNEFLKKI